MFGWFYQLYVLIYKQIEVAVHETHETTATNLELS